jgi:VWFA-related protein
MMQPVRVCQRLPFGATLMIRPLVAALLACGAAVSVAGQATPPAQDRQTFRSGVDLIQLDVSVLDGDRRPVRGLTAADFTLLEDGKPQRIVAFNAIDISDLEPEVVAAAPWVREVASDVRRNTGPDGRLFTIVMDDGLIPFDPWMVNHAKEIARRVVEGMRPGDLASVIFTASNQHAQDFTNDRALLYRAIDRFRGGWSGCGGLTEGQFSSFIDGPMNVLFHAMQSLAAAPQRRKSVIFVSVSLPNLRGEYIKQEMYRRAQFANVSIYPIDPSGLRMEAFLLGRQMAAGCEAGPSPPRLARDFHFLIRDLLDTAAENRHALNELAANTGGRAILHNDDGAQEVDGILAENASYYVLGYESPKQGDRLRRIEVKVDRPGVMVRSRNMWRPGEELKPGAAPSLRAEHALAQVIPAADIPLRIVLAPFATPGRPGATVAMAIGLIEAPPAARATEKVNVAIGAFTGEGFHRATRRQEATITLLPAADTPAEIDLLANVDLRPGRYSIRVGAHSGFSNKGGSVYADVDVPDFAGAPLSLSGVVLTASPGPMVAPRDHLAKLLSIVPTTRRAFTRADAVRAFLRVYQAGRAPLLPVSMAIRIVDATDAVLLAQEEELEAGRFKRDRAADYQFQLPLAQLPPGEYLLTLTASRGDLSEQRHVRFSVR